VFLEAVMKAEGGVRLGAIWHDLDLEAWWFPTAKIQVIAVPIRSGGGSGSVLLKGSKAYFVTTIAREGETWARDVNALADYLESHFPEVHLAFSHFRDVPVLLASRRVALSSGRRGARGAIDSACLNQHLRDAREQLASLQRLREIAGDDDGLLGPHLAAREASQRRHLETLKTRVAVATADEQRERHLQEEYLRKGSAACLTFSISSNLQVVESERDAREALRAILRELIDADRFQVRQTLGGRLRVQVSEACEPALAWIEQWFGGAISPTQLERLGARSHTVDALSAYTQVAPDDDIRVEGEVVDHRKLLAPRVISSLLRRVDRAEDVVDRAAAAGSGPGLFVGMRMAGDRVTQTPWSIPINGITHALISGMTGSGKSVLVRVLAEEAATLKDVNVLILDPRNQSAGLLVPEDRAQMLSRYAAFGLKDPGAFAFAYHAPANAAADPLPSDLGDVSMSHRVVSFKGVDDSERCGLFADILNALFDRLSSREVEWVRQVVLIEEAQLFTRRLTADAAGTEAKRAEAALDRLLREGRKFGICVLVSSQSVKDFSREAVSIRQNAGTKVFLHNSDREVEYARDYLDDSREIIKLRPGEAIFCNPAWGVVRVSVRPPLSKVWDFGESETAALLGARGDHRSFRLSPEASQLLDVIRTRYAELGEPPNVSEIGRAAGITSKRRLQELIGELTGAGHAKTRRLREQGQPRVVEPIDRTEDGHKRTGGER
jgi:hypothetical protein